MFSKTPSQPHLRAIFFVFSIASVSDWAYRPPDSEIEPDTMPRASGDIAKICESVA